MMEIHLLGKTGLSVTPLGLGLAALGRPGYINLGHAQDLAQNYDPTVMKARAHQVLDAAWEVGIRYFDAARSYGRAEQFLGSWLRSRQIAPNAVTVGSKWGYTYTAGWRVQAEKHEVKEHSSAVLQKQIGQSRQELGRYLDLYQIHSATLDSGVLENAAVLSQLADLKAEGLRIGLSLSGSRQPETLLKALEISLDGRPLFDAVQATWNLLETSAGPALKQAGEAGLGIVVKETLANGRLTSRNDDPAFRAKGALLEQMSRERNTTIDALSLAAVLAQPWVDIALSGAANVDHLRSNVTALDIIWTEKTAAMLESLAEPPEQYWQTRSELPWN